MTFCHKCPGSSGVEQWTENPRVGGSNPPPGTIITKTHIIGNIMAHNALLKDVFGFDFFRPGQEEIIQASIAGKNILAIMPTGGGKSLCFQLPALMRDGVTVVISPLIALMLSLIHI